MDKILYEDEEAAYHQENCQQLSLKRWCLYTNSGDNNTISNNNKVKEREKIKKKELCFNIR